ncbi:MAG: Uncharacterised protein [Flavobacteriia bacterium]|nr:MAG: Uncharacterised protein [Flavobacteriia bacterium]
MKTLKTPFVLIWKVWFYVAVFLVIVAIFPFIWRWSRKESDYPRFFVWSQIWAKAVLMGSFLPLSVRRKTEDLPKQCIIVSNHTSMLDIPYNLLLFPRPFLFIGKVELSRLPLFGHFYKRTNILIDRSSLKSVRETMRVADEKLNEGYSLCIYPEGGVPEHEVFIGKFKEGAFRLAKEHGLPLLPITFADNKKAYPYVWNLGGPRRLRATIHEPLATDGKSVEELKKILRTTFENELEEYGISNETQ